MSVVVLTVPGMVLATLLPTRCRRRQRGFDQAELLATALARRWDRPCRRLLDRSPGPPQTGLSLADRRRGPCFMPQGAAPLGVIVVDDVVTTGSTLTAASWALRSAGASWVGALTAAQTPRLATLLPVPPSPPSSVPLSVPGTPPDVESSLKFCREGADVPQ